MADERWTAETRELVEQVFGGVEFDLTDEVLTALADAGLLLPPGGETREEWGTKVWVDGVDPSMVDVEPHTSRSFAEGRVERHQRHRAANPPDEDSTAQDIVRPPELDLFR